MHIAVLGIGEAGGHISADLAGAGLRVTAWDPEPKSYPPGVIFAKSDHDAVRDADIILSVNVAEEAVGIAAALRDTMFPARESFRAVPRMIA